MNQVLPHGVQQPFGIVSLSEDVSLLNLMTIRSGIVRKMHLCKHFLFTQQEGLGEKLSNLIGNE